MHDKDSTPIEVIDIESLQQANDSVALSKQTNNSKSYIWIAFIFLLLCAISVFFLLPKYIAQQPESSITTTEPTVDVQPAEEEVKIEDNLLAETSMLSAEELSILKKQAEERLLIIIKKQKLLESKAVKKWASEEYKVALNLGAKGDEHFRKQDFKQALETYNDAVDALTRLENKIAPTLAMHLEKGEEALIKADKNIAKHHFQLASEIDNSNLQATNGLQRAETIEELYALLETGGKFEAANRFKKAKDTYQQATELDPLSDDAKQALKRVSTRLTQIEFNRLMNQGHASLNLEQYSDARNAYKAAQKLAPDSNLPKQGLAKIQRALFNKKLNTLNAEARHFEENQDWANAAHAYEQILSLSPDARSAQEGYERTQFLDSTLKQLNELNANFLRLSSKSVASEAEQLLVSTEKIVSPGEKIEQARVKLKQQLALANKPITITLQSDQQTDIAIYKIGKFGKFSSREIDLKPGRYTIVGSRKGYRDVRKEVTVLAEMVNKTIEIQCDEPI